jgi:hypothetical protein
MRIAELRVIFREISWPSRGATQMKSQSPGNEGKVNKLQELTENLAVLITASPQNQQKTRM